MLRLLTAILIFFVTPSLQAAIPQETTEASSKYLNSEKGYSITFPEHWQVQKNFMSVDVFAAAPAENEIDGSKANISIISGPIGNISLEDFYQKNLESLKKSLEDFKIIETGNALIDGKQAKKIAYNHSLGGILKIRVVQYFIMDKTNGIIITFSSDLSDYNKFGPIFESVIKTFKFTH